jgi:DNA-binding winged helix-turn-helix (wHTH) protein/tetratricopeptide (TPR) repeat protein
LRKYGLRLRVHDQPFEVLRLLLERPGEIVTREEIQQKLWPAGTFVDFENGLNSAVRRLRDALGDSAEEPRFIETVPRHGYRLIVRVERSNAKLTPLAEIGPSQTRRWSRWLWAASVAAVVLTTVGVASWKSYGGTRTAMKFGPRDWVLVANFENRTGNPVFDGTLEFAIARELANSQYVTVVSPERIGDVLRLMKKPPDTKIDASLGREICLRDGGIRALLTGRVEKLGTTYVLSAALVDPVQGVSVASLSEEDPADSQMAAAVHRLSNRVRETLGEKTAQIQQSDKRLEKVTTPSLHALQLYTQADTLIRLNEQAAAAKLLEQSLVEDPNFASAHLLLGYTYINRDKQAEAKREFQRALDLADTTPDRERLFIEATYYTDVQKDMPRVFQTYEALVRLYPDHFWAGSNLRGMYVKSGRWDDVLKLTSLLADINGHSLRPDDLINNETVACGMYFNGNPEGAMPYIKRVRAIAATDPSSWRAFADEGEMLLVFDSWAHGDVNKARAQFIQLEKSDRDFDYPEFLWSLGEIREANKRILEKTDEPGVNISLGWGSYIKGDLQGAKKYFQKFQKYDGWRDGEYPLGYLGETWFLVMGRSGLWDQVEAVSRRMEPFPGNEIVQGELAMARGQTKKGTILLEKGLDAAHKYPGSSFYLGSETLARAYEKQGNFEAALRVLKRASDAKWKAAFGCASWEFINGPWWLRDELELADLYRKMGRLSKAEEAEDELRKMLVYADADHPILRELKKREGRSSAGTLVPGNNARLGETGGVLAGQTKLN